MTAPDPTKTITTEDGVEIPLGKGQASDTGHSSLLYNEYPFKRAQFVLSIMFHIIVLRYTREPG